MLRHGIDERRFECFQLQVSGFLLKKAFDTHHDAVFHPDMLGKLLAILKVELASKATFHIINMFANVAFFENDFPLSKLHWHQDAL